MTWLTDRHMMGTGGNREVGLNTGDLIKQHGHTYDSASYANEKQRRCDTSTTRVGMTCLSSMYATCLPSMYDACKASVVWACFDIWWIQMEETWTIRFTVFHTDGFIAQLEECWPSKTSGLWIFLLKVPWRGWQCLIVGKGCKITLTL